MSPKQAERTKKRIDSAPTTEGQAAAARIAEFRQNINNGATAKEARATVRELGSAPTLNAKATPQNTPSTAITSDALAPTDKPTLSAQVPVSTEQTKLQTDLEAEQEAYTQGLQEKAKTAEQGKTTALDEYLTSLRGAKGQTTLESKLYGKKGGVDDITVELNDINDQIRREQLSLRRATENIQKVGGQSKAQAQAEINNLTRESLAKQADLSVIQQAVQGRYDSAKTIADRAVSAYLEQQRQELEIKQFNYTENKELFTKAEQRAFESEQADRKRKLDQEAQRLSEIKQFALSALQAGASTAEVKQAMAAKTLDEAISLVGGYLRPKPAVTSSKPSITEIDGKPYIWDEATGQYVPAGEYIKGGGMDTAQSQQITETLSLARSLKQPGAVGKGSAVGASFAKFVPFGQSLGLQGNRTAFENKVNTLKANLTLDNLGLLKGPMSDKDLAFLQAVGSSLTTDMSEAEFDNELTKVINKLEKAQGYTKPTFQSNPTALPFTSTNLLQVNTVTAPDGSQVEIID